VDLQFKNGSIDLKVKAKATASWPWPDYNNIVIHQRLTLVLNGQRVALQASDSDLTIAGITGLGSAKANSRARTAIIAERDKALPDAQQALDDALQSASEQANHALTSFDDSASASYTALEITADGIIVRGAIDTKERYDPVVVIGETDDGKAFTALNSWIPGGRITGFEWSWLEATEFLTGPFNFGHYELKTASDEHRFIFPKPAAVSGVSGICLKVVGTQVSANGGVEFVSDGVGDACSIDTWLPPILVVPSWLEQIIGTLWLPDPPPDGILEESIVGHVNVLAQPVSPGGLTTNSLVYFAGPLADKPLEALEQGLARVMRRDFALTFVVVMPKGTFATHRRREVEERLGSLGDRFTSGPLIITEDYVEGWTRTFGVAEAPASYIVNTRGEFVWKHEGKLDPNVLASALHKHLLPSQRRRALPMRLAVKPGERALDATFDDDQGQTLALRRLRGQRVLLNFWQSWSAPCVRELRRLQRLQEETGPRAPFIVAVHGGGERRVLDEVRRQNNLSFMLVHDSDQRIARMYGVQCWPTTLSINPDGIVDRIQFGISHEHRAEARAQTA
jgi:peroxiredoxin